MPWNPSDSDQSHQNRTTLWVAMVPWLDRSLVGWLPLDSTVVFNRAQTEGNAQPLRKSCGKRGEHAARPPGRWSTKIKQGKSILSYRKTPVQMCQCIPLPVLSGMFPSWKLVEFLSQDRFGSWETLIRHITQLTSNQLSSMSLWIPKIVGPCKFQHVTWRNYNPIGRSSRSSFILLAYISVFKGFLALDTAAASFGFLFNDANVVRCCKFSEPNLWDMSTTALEIPRMRPSPT